MRNADLTSATAEAFRHVRLLICPTFSYATIKVENTKEKSIMTEQKRENIRSLMRWFFVLIISHVLSALLYNIVFNRMVRELATDRYASRANSVVLIYGLAFLLVFCIWYALDKSRYTEYRTTLKKAMAEEGFTLFGYFKAGFIKMNLLRALVYVIFQIPFMIFYALAGFSATHTTAFEKFYITEVGFYQLTGISPVGALLAGIYLAIALIVTQLAFLIINYRYVLENSPTLSGK